MKWYNARKISDSVIENVEEKLKIHFPNDYVEMVKKHNAAIPEKQFFKCGEKKYIFARLISVEKTDNPNILTAISWINTDLKGDVIVPIALDPFGNMLCFQFENGVDVIFLEFETGKKEILSNSFNSFINSLF